MGRKRRAEGRQKKERDWRTPRGLERGFLAVLVVVAGLLLLPNLGEQLLWQDEAQTALLARTILERGMPYGHDGLNYFSQELGAEYGEGHVWKWHTWLSFYLVAGSFWLLGATTVAARLPFVLLGIATVVLLHRFASDLWKDRFAGVASAVMLLTSVPFLLLVRQCRYYGAAMSLALLALWAYVRLLEGRRHALVTLIAAGTLLFHTHYIYAASLVAAVGIHGLVVDRRRWRKVLWGCGGITVLCAPWALWLAGMRYAERYGSKVLRPSHALRTVESYAAQVGEYLLPVLVLVALLGATVAALVLGRHHAATDPPRWKALLLPVLFIGLTLAALALTAPAPMFRYLAPAIPPSIALAGLLVALAGRLHAAVGVALLVFHVALQPLGDYLYELTHDFEGPIEGIVRYLDEHARPGETVAITYGDLPLKFYTGLRVVGGPTGEDLSPAKDARWVIVRHHTVSGKDRAVREYLRRNLNPNDYRRITLEVRDTRFENRESPHSHRYRTARKGPKVVILERLAP